MTDSAGEVRRAIYREASRAATLGLVVNLLLGVVKLVGGILGGSFAMVADAVNSLGDVFTSLVVLVALRVAELPADKEHPYGHTRAEAIAASNVALLVMLSALAVGWEAIQRLRVQHPLPPAWTLWIAAANIVVKECLYHYKLRVGRRTGSEALIAHAWDHRSDALCSLAVLVGLGVVRFGGPGVIAADEISALVVVVAIVWSAGTLFYKCAHQLMDVQADEPLVAAIRQSAASVPGVRGVEKLWVRKTGLEYLVDVHIEVDGQLAVHEGHRIGHVVKDRLLGEYPALRDVLVHLEPYPHERSGTRGGSIDPRQPSDTAPQS
jgi:cation diffusion facilitator family transporter